MADIVNGSLFDGQERIKAESLVDAQPFSQYKSDECVGNTASEMEGTSMCEVLDKIVAEGEARGEARDEARGEARGIEKTKTEMVLNMLRENLSVEMIARIAKLTVEQVMAISKKAAVL